MTKVLVIASEKGGLGRTTWAKHIGCVLAQRGKHVVLVDTDTQGSLTYEMGIQVDVTRGDKVLYDFINRKQPFSSVLARIPQERYSATDTTGGLWLLPSNEETMHIAAIHSDSLLFRSRINQIKLANRFDLIVIDTSPAPGMIHPPIYKAGDGVLLLAVPEDSPVRQLHQTVNHLINAQEEREGDGLGQIQVLGILPNRVKRRVALHEMFLEQIEADFGEQVPILPYVPDHIAWAEASRWKKSVTVTHASSEAADIARRVGDHIERWL